MFFIVMLTLVISILMTKVVVHIANSSSQVVLDSQLDGVQRMHDTPVPRIGGLAIFTSMVFIALYGANTMASWSQFYSGMIASLFFVFIGGFTEDLAKNITPMIRVVFLISAVIFATFVVHTMFLVRNVDHETINQILKYDIFAFAVTCFAVVGISNAYNMIDGYNGLASTTAMINSLCLMYLSYRIGDMNSVMYSGILFAAILGFWVFNYPLGKVFLGDGGSYVIGFMISLISIDLVGSNVGKISPFAVLLLVIYPFTEAVFTIIRRKFIHKTKATQPDILHLHQLVFSRCFHNQIPLLKRNARVMPILLLMTLPPSICTLFIFNSTSMVLLVMFIYVIYYVYIYVQLIRFRTPLVFGWVAKLLTNRIKVAS